MSVALPSLPQQSDHLLAYILVLAMFLAIAYNFIKVNKRRAQALRTCPKCGTKITAGAALCPSCGEPV